METGFCWPVGALARWPVGERVNSRGFTFFEILITLTLLAVLFVPMMQLFSHALEGTSTSREIITASSLVRWEIERVKNLGTSTERIRSEGNAVWPPEGEPAFRLNDRSWRIFRKLEEGSEPLKVTVEVHLEGQSEPIATLVSLFTDTSWGRER